MNQKYSGNETHHGSDVTDKKFVNSSVSDSKESGVGQSDSSFPGVTNLVVVSVSLVATVFMLTAMVSPNAIAAGISETGSAVLDIQPTAISRAVGDSIDRQPELSRSLILVAANDNTHTQTKTVSTTDSSSQRSMLLLTSRTQELMDIDNREVDQISARLKQIIKARYEADSLNGNTVETINALRRKIADFEGLLKNADSERDQLNNEKGDLQNRINQILSERDAAQDEINALNKEMQNQQGSVQTLRTETESSGAMLAMKERELDELKDQLSALQKESDDGESMLANLRIKTGNTAAERDSALAEVAAVENILNQKADQIDDLNGRLDSLASERDLANAELAVLQSKYEEADALTNEVLAERNNLAGSLSLFETKASDVNSALLAEQQNHAQTQAAVAALENNIDQLETELNLVSTGRDTLLAEKSHLEATSIDLNNRIAEVEEELGTRQRELQSSLSSISNLNGQIGDLVRERNAALGSISDLEGLMADLQKDKVESDRVTQDRLLAANNEVTLQRAALDSEIAMRDQSIADRDNQLSTLKEEMASRLNSWSSEIAGKEKEIAELRGSIADLTSQHQQLQNLASAGELELGQMATEISGIMSSRDTTRELVDQLKLLNSKLAAQVETTSDELEAVTADGERKLALLNNRISELETSNMAASDEIEKLTTLNSDLANLTTGLESEINATRKNLESVSKKGSVRVKNLLAQIDGLENQLSEVSARELVANEKLKVFEHANGSLLDQLELSHKENKNSSDEMDKLRLTLNEYESKINIANQNLRDLEAAELLAQAERDAVIAEAEILRISLTDELNDARLETITVQKTRADNSIPLRLGNADFFAPGSARLTKGGAENLSKLASIIQNYSDRRIVVEGHTDNVPIGAGLKYLYESNWELSVARAAAAVRHMQFNTQIDPVNLSAAGYGQYKPVAANDTHAGRQQNRRVEVVLYPRPDKYADIETEAEVIHAHKGMDSNMQAVEISATAAEENVSAIEE